VTGEDARRTPDGPAPTLSEEQQLVIDLDRSRLTTLCERALRGAGATPAQATVLAEATVQAELLGHRAVGLSHLLDYLDGFHTGRIASGAEPTIEQRSAVVTAVDCRGGLAQHGFEVALAGMCQAADAHGLSVTALRYCFTAGELDYYVRRLNGHGLMGLACANSPALMTVAGARGPVLGSNPFAFGVSLPDGRRLAVDQATSATAWVTVRDAAVRGEAIPATWAVDRDGEPTTSAAAGLEGALLPFGGYKGGNVALLVELLATLAGGRFSTDAAPFDRGAECPSVGVVVVAVSTGSLDPGYVPRLAAQLERWRSEQGAQPDVWTTHREATTCPVPRDLHERLQAIGAQAV
jgi:(2R)-3-sulfolactate dehydrogenase (NADP+)